MGKMKKYKGHTIIELKDPETGEVVKRVESDNMFTNAINKMVDFAMRHAYGSNGFTNMYTQHLWYFTGLVGWDGTIEEDADNFWPPAGVKPTVYGAQGTANSSASWLQMGTYDNTESDTSQTFIKKFVWNYTKAQGNGRISCITLVPRPEAFACFGGPPGWMESLNFSQGYYYPVIELTHVMVDAGNLSRLNAPNQHNYAYEGQVGVHYCDFCIDADDGVKYMIKVNADSVSIVKHTLDPTYFDVFRSCAAIEPYDEETYQITFNAAYFKWFYNTDEQKLYFWNVSSNEESYGNNTERAVFVYDIVNKTLTKKGIWKNQTGSNVCNNLIITSNAIYEFAYNNGNIYKYTFGLGTESVGSTELIGATANYSNNRRYYQKCTPWILNGVIYAPSMTCVNGGYITVRTTIIDTSDDSIRNANQSYNPYCQSQGISINVPPIDKTQVVFFSGSNANMTSDGSSYNNAWNIEGGNDTKCNTFTPCCFLSTINNLAEPVVKDATKTMTITYIIEAAEV